MWRHKVKISFVQLQSYPEYKNISFAQNHNIKLESVTGVDSFVTECVNKTFAESKAEAKERIGDKFYDNFQNEWLARLNGIQRYENKINRAEILNKLSMSYYDSGDVEKSAVILASSFNLLQDKPVFEIEKLRYQSLVKNPQNFKILKDFYKTSQNHNARFFVTESLRKLNSSYYLPVAEDILEYDKDTMIYSDKATSVSARKFLHSFYNFNLLKDALKQSSLYKSAALSVLDKWGVKEDIPLVELFKSDEDVQIKNKAKYVASKLQADEPTSPSSFVYKHEISPEIYNENISTPLLIDFVIKDNDVSAYQVLKSNKYPDGTYSASLVSNAVLEHPETGMIADLIKFVGQTGSLLKHLDCVKPDVSKPTAFDNIKAEAYYKIMLRNNMKQRT